MDHTQRLNLHALLGAQRADVGSIRAIWALQDKIALDADEEKAIELKRELVAGLERSVWNPALSIPPKGFEFADTEISRIKAVLESWNAYAADADRLWREPLISALAVPCYFGPEEYCSRLRRFGEDRERHVAEHFA